jgi:hypothetical protein
MPIKNSSVPDIRCRIDTIPAGGKPDSENKIVGVREAVAIIRDGDTVACCSVCSDASRTSINSS